MECKEQCASAPGYTLQVDLINYGLIPEFVGRFPIICSLQVRLHWQPVRPHVEHFPETVRVDSGLAL